MSPSQPFDASIPVLTEVIGIEAEAAPAAHAGAVPPVPAADPVADAVTDRSPPPVAEPVFDAVPDAVPDAAALERQAVAAWGPEQWAALEQRLAGRILRQLQGRVDVVLEQRIRDGMADVFQRALGTLTDELRDGLGQTIGQLVARAVSEELAHLKSGQP